VGVRVLVAIRGAVFVHGRSLSVGARCSWVGGCRRPFALEDGGGGRSFRGVVLGWSWWGYGCGRAMVSGSGMVVVVASRCCCSWAAVPVRPCWVIVCWRRAVVVGGWGMVVLGWGMIVRG
jgi:hypothetical protein